MTRKKKEQTPAEKLKEKLHEKKLERTKKLVRENLADKLEEKLDKSKNPKERKQLKHELKILEEIKQRQDTFTGEFPDYGDNATYGGGLEHPE